MQSIPNLDLHPNANASPQQRVGPKLPTPRRLPVILFAMALSKRLQQVQEIAEPIVLDFSKWSMAELEASQIDFGQAQKGKSYAQVWNEAQGWVTWFVQHYEKSNKPAHQKFLHYVTLKVEKAELTKQKIPVVDNVEAPKKIPQTHQIPKIKAKAKGRSSARTEETPCPWDDVEDPSIFEMIDAEEIEEVPVLEPLWPNTSQLEARVANMENALSRVMEFLEQNHAVQQNNN